MQEGLSITYSSCTHIGLTRQENQDCYSKAPVDNNDLNAAKGQLFIVADGMGGHLGGQEASKMAVELIQGTYFSDFDKDITRSLERGFKKANLQIYLKAKKTSELKGMGTTCTALILKNNKAHLLHVGDSRAYRINRSKIIQLTRDHSRVAELFREGVLTKKEAIRHPERNILNRYLGARPTLKVDIIKDMPLYPGDYYLLCTDGVSRIKDKEMQRLVVTNPPHQACKKLINLANKRGGEDNVTLHVIQVGANSSLLKKIVKKLKQ